MCGERAKSKVQLGRSKIDLFSGATGTTKNELKRPRQANSSLRPPLPPKKRQVASPPPSKPDCTISTGAADVSADSTSNSKAPHGVFDFPMPKPASVFDIYQFYDVFFKSFVDRSPSPTKPIVLEGFQQYEEVMDPEMEHIWRPILRKPLIPIVYKQRRYRF